MRPSPSLLVGIPLFAMFLLVAGVSLHAAIQEAWRTGLTPSAGYALATALIPTAVAIGLASTHVPKPKLERALCVLALGMFVLGYAVWGGSALFGA